MPKSATSVFLARASPSPPPRYRILGSRLLTHARLAFLCLFCYCPGRLQKPGFQGLETPAGKGIVWFYDGIRVERMRGDGVIRLSLGKLLVNHVQVVKRTNTPLIP